MKKLLVLLLTIIIIGDILVVSISLKYKFFTKRSISYESVDILKVENAKDKLDYITCMNKPFKSDTIEKEFNENLRYLQSLGVSIYFKDINNDYTWSMNSTNIYYSASTSKLFEVIYLIERAREGLVDLNDTVIYYPTDEKSSSKGMINHEYYDSVSLSKLIEYILTYSDNTAHLMLIRYIGLNNLKEYFSDYNLSISENDPFVKNYTAQMALKCMENIYRLLEVEDEYTTLLKNSMDNNNLNYLNFDNKNFKHKYGFYKDNFHDIGIYYDKDYPYIVVILTLYGNLGKYTFGPMVSEISEKIYNLYNQNLTLKEEYCKNR